MRFHVYYYLVGIAGRTGQLGTVYKDMAPHIVTLRQGLEQRPKNLKRHEQHFMVWCF